MNYDVVERYTVEIASRDANTVVRVVDEQTGKSRSGSTSPFLAARMVAILIEDHQIHTGARAEHTPGQEEFLAFLESLKSKGSADSRS